MTLFWVMGVTKKGHQTLSPSGSVFALQCWSQKCPIGILIPGCWEVEKRNSLSRINFNQWSDSFQTVIVRLRTQISGKLPGEVGYFHPSTVLPFSSNFVFFKWGVELFFCVSCWTWPPLTVRTPLVSFHPCWPFIDFAVVLIAARLFNKFFPFFFNGIGG